MDRKIDIIVKNIHHPRLTVTKDRVTMKFPPNFPDQKRLEEKFLKVAEKIGKPDHSLRSSLLQGQYLSMRNDKREVLFHFDLEQI